MWHEATGTVSDDHIMENSVRAFLKTYTKHLIQARQQVLGKQCVTQGLRTPHIVCLAADKHINAKSEEKTNTLKQHFDLRYTLPGWIYVDHLPMPIRPGQALSALLPYLILKEYHGHFNKILFWKATRDAEYFAIDLDEIDTDTWHSFPKSGQTVAEKMRVFVACWLYHAAASNIPPAACLDPENHHQIPRKLQTLSTKHLKGKTYQARFAQTLRAMILEHDVLRLWLAKNNLQLLADIRQHGPRPQNMHPVDAHGKTKASLTTRVIGYMLCGIGVAAAVWLTIRAVAWAHGGVPHGTIAIPIIALLLVGLHGLILASRAIRQQHRHGQLDLNLITPEESRRYHQEIRFKALTAWHKEEKNKAVKDECEAILNDMRG